MSDIPDSWTHALLSEIAFIQMGQSPNSRSYNEIGEGLPFFQGKADFGSLYPTVRKWCTEPQKIAEAGDILLSVRAPVGPTNLASERCCIGRGLAAIQAVTPFNQKYLLHFFRNIEIWLSQQGTGTTFAGIGSREIHKLEVPVAPADEQNRIADKLDNLLARVDKCRDRLSHVEDIFQRFRQSVLKAAVSGEITEDFHKNVPYADGKPSDWIPISFNELIESSLYGPRFSKKDYVSNGIPTIRTTDMSFDGSIDLKDSPQVSVSSEEFKKWGLLDGDLLITRTGSTIGKCAIYREAIGPAMPSAYLIRFRLDQKKVIPSFILLFLLSPQGQSLLVGSSSSVAQPNINARAQSVFQGAKRLMYSIDSPARLSLFFWHYAQIQRTPNISVIFLERCLDGVSTMSATMTRSLPSY